TAVDDLFRINHGDVVEFQALDLFDIADINNRIEPAALVGEDARLQWPLGIVGADKAHRFAIENGLSGLRILIDAAAYFILQIRDRLWSAVVDRELMHAKTLAHKFTQGVFPCIHTSRGAGLAGIANHRHPA